MKSMFASATVLIFSNFCGAQLSQHYDCAQVDKMFIKSEVRPKFGGGTTDLREYLDSSFKKINYSFNAKVLVFINIDSTGSPCCHQILKSFDGTVDFDTLKRVVDRMPRWSSAKQNGHNVNSYVTVQLFYTEDKLNVKLN
jgi:hypothetical protein